MVQSEEKQNLPQQQRQPNIFFKIHLRQIQTGYNLRSVKT